MSDFHLLRPWWLLALIPLFALAWAWWSGKAQSRDWSAVIDPRLLPHLLVGESTRQRRWPILFWLLLALLSVLALAGPVWKKLPQPVFKQQSALVILLDLSASMNAQDIKPSRIARARLKLIDLLNARKEGQAALIAYAATAYTVTPLTDDTETIKALVSSLKPEIMPAQGSRPDRAIARALELFKNAGVAKGDILLISDGVRASDIATIKAQKLSNFRLSVLSVGTEQGAPIPRPGGGFVKDAQGSIVVAKMSRALLQQLATRYGGVYSPLTLDDSDIKTLQRLLAATQWKEDQKQLDFTSDRWREEGPWLLLLVAPLAALAFRRGLLLTLLLAVMLTPMAQRAEAFELGQWKHWFMNNEQQARQLLQQGDASDAARKFQHPDWKGAALYKSGDYEQALQQLEKTSSLENEYNRANALAKLARYKDALKVYDDVLKKNPQHKDAAYNRKLVEKALKKQQQQNNKKRKDKNNKNKKNKDQQKQDNKDQKNSDQKNRNQKNQSKNGQNKKSQSKKDQSKNDKNKSDQAQQKQDEKSVADQARKDQAKEKKAQQKQQAQQQKKKQDQSAQKKKQAAKKDKPGKDKNSRQQRQQDQKQRLSKQAEQQWLRRIPDDPGGLLRNKFRYQYSRQQPATQEKQQW